MVLGTVLSIARRRGDVALASALEPRLSTELARRARTGADATALLEAAGNGSCGTCGDEIARAIGSKDSRIRRIAVGALRFSNEPVAVSTACRALRDDEEVTVRAHAAWSLGWSRVGLDLRAECLRDALENDPDREVRESAAQALARIVGSADLTGG